MTMMSRRSSPSRLHLRGDRGAVSDVVGSILLVAITVTLATVMGALVFSFKGPVDFPQANLAISVSPGNAAWGNGDEQLIVRNVGGEAIEASQTTILYKINIGAPVSITGTALGFPNGRLSIGQTWTLTLTLQSTDNVLLNVVSRQTGGSAGSQLLATATLVPGQVSSGAACPFDTTAPSAGPWVQSPSDVTSLSSGAITVSVTLLDNCAGVDTAFPPHLFWRLRGLSAPAYADAGAMTTQGLSVWTGTVPSQTWSAQSGKVLEYYIASYKDLRANAGTSSTQSDVIDADCTGDTTPPSVTWQAASPANLVSTTPAGTVTVTGTIVDNCWGVDDTTATPTLAYRLNDGTNPAYVAGGALSRVGAPANHQWTGVVPSQTWYLQAGRTLQYQFLNLKDAAGNTGPSAAQSDLVDIVSPTYITTGGIVATAGTITNAVGATAAGGTEASMTEVPVTFAIQPGTSNTGSNSVSETSCPTYVNQACALLSDDQFATLSSVNANLYVDGIWTTPPAGAGGITQVLIGFEARKSSTGTSPTITMDYAVGGATGPTTLTGATLSSNTVDDVTTLDVTADRSWTTADIQALAIHFTLTARPSANANVDQLFVKVSYAVTGGAGRGMNQVLTFANVPNSSPTTGAQTLDLGYHISPIVANDVFIVGVFNPSTGAWRVCPSQLNSVSVTAVAYTCQLTLLPTEYNNGAPKVRIRDVNPASTVTTTVLLDYARISTT